MGGGGGYLTIKKNKVCVLHLHLISFFLNFSVRVFICFDPEPPLQPVGLKHEPTEQSLRQRAAITRAGLLKASDYISTAFETQTQSI